MSQTMPCFKQEMNFIEHLPLIPDNKMDALLATQQSHYMAKRSFYITLRIKQWLRRFQEL